MNIRVCGVDCVLRWHWNWKLARKNDFQGRFQLDNLALNHPAHKGCWYLTMPEGNRTFSWCEWIYVKVTVSKLWLKSLKDGEMSKKGGKYIWLCYAWLAVLSIGRLCCEGICQLPFELGLRVNFFNAVCMAEMLPERVTSYHFEEKLMDRLQSYNRYPNFVQPSGPVFFPGWMMSYIFRLIFCWLEIRTKGWSPMQSSMWSTMQSSGTLSRRELRWGIILTCRELRVAFQHVSALYFFCASFFQFSKHVFSSRLSLKLWIWIWGQFPWGHIYHAWRWQLLPPTGGNPLDTTENTRCWISRPQRTEFVSGSLLFWNWCLFSHDKVWPEFHGIPPPLRSEMVLYLAEAGWDKRELAGSIPSVS